MPLDLSQTRVMGILNVTPDSFSDGGRYMQIRDALAQVRRMQDEGAAIIDIGGESTRPGATAVSEQEELDRVIPVIEAMRRESDIPISIDTSKPGVMRAAVAAGADMINDVMALRAEGALQTAAQLQVPVCLMHMQGEPRTMQVQPTYQDVYREIKDFLLQRRTACLEAGLKNEQIILDPGFGFGKTVQHNLKLMNALPQLCALGSPVLIGVSRKSLLGSILEVDDPEQRLFGAIALATLACWWGVRIIRAHDVAATVQAITTCHAVKMTNI